MRRIHLRVVSAALVLTLTVGASAGDDQDHEHGHGDSQALQALEARIEALEATVATLQQQVGDLQTSHATLQNQLATVQANHALQLGPYVSVDLAMENGVRAPNIVFSGANIHIVTGSGATDDNGDPTGLGNLIVGYDESPPSGSVDRSGSHNLVIGRYHQFTGKAFGGLVAGEKNTLDNMAASVSGGFQNTVDGHWASVSGGANNTASGPSASVSGGIQNTASGLFAASVSGGSGNSAGSDYAVVLGGVNVIDNNPNSIAPGAPLNFP